MLCLGILKKYEVVLSLGNGLRAGAISDSFDRAMIQELLNGKAHAMVASSPQPAQLVAKNPDKLFLLEDVLMKEPISMGVRKGDPDTLAYLNNWIVVHQASGWLKTKAAYWWGTMDWLPLIE